MGYECEQVILCPGALWDMSVSSSYSALVALWDMSGAALTLPWGIMGYE